MCGLAAGDAESYQRRCRDLLRRTAASKDTWIAEHVGRALCIRPDSVAAWSDAVTVTATLAKSAPPGPSAIVVRAAVLYRAGRFAEARDLLRLQNSKVQNRNGLAAQLLLALCDHRLNRQDASLQRIDQALAPMQTQASLSWSERLFVQAWRKEAEALRDPEKK
jgi:hypothetical protein